MAVATHPRKEFSLSQLQCCAIRISDGFWSLFPRSDSAQRTNPAGTKKKKQKESSTQRKLPDCKITAGLDLLLASSSHPPSLSLPLPFPFPFKPQGAAIGSFISGLLAFVAPSPPGLALHPEPPAASASLPTEFPGCSGCGWDAAARTTAPFWRRIICISRRKGFFSSRIKIEDKLIRAQSCGDRHGVKQPPQKNSYFALSASWFVIH